jgi:hypothetical protein
MTSTGMLITAIINGSKLSYSLALRFPEAGVFYLAKANLSGQFLSEKILEGE